MSYKYFKGFTLAEVLITLGVIGVVAAMTMPALIQKHQEKVTVNKVKKIYAVMQNALLLAIKDNGTVDEWEYNGGTEQDGNSSTKESAEAFAAYLKPYLKISKDCGTTAGCIYSGYYKILSGEDWADYGNRENYYKMILLDSSYIWMRTGASGCVGNDGDEPNVCANFWIDVNGKNPPNTIGIDTFAFQIKKDRIIPIRGECNRSTNGFACTEVLLTTGKMDYLKE